MKAFAAVSLTICMIGFFMKLFQIMFEEYLTWIEDEEERGYYGRKADRTDRKERREEDLQNRFYKQPKRRKKALASKLPRRRR